MITTIAITMLSFSVYFNPLANKEFIKPKAQVEIKIYENEIKR